MSNLGININYNIAETVENILNNKLQYIPLTRMELMKKAEQTQLTGYNALKNLFTTFQTQAANFAKSFDTIAYQANSLNTVAVGNVSVTNNNVAVGSHTVVVSQLAVAQRQVSNVDFNSKNQALGFNQTLNFANTATPASNFSVEITTSDTLETVRDKINNSADNIGLTASIVSFTSGSDTKYKLVLASKEGEANQITISGDPGNNFNFAETVAAKNAEFTFDGLNQVRSSNTITDVMDGLSFTLLASGSTANINITPGDKNAAEGIKSALQNMLTAYNQIISFLDANQVVTIYDDKESSSQLPDEQKLKAMAYNNNFSFIKSQMSNVINQTFSNAGSFEVLNELGITYAPSQILQDQFDRNRKVSSYGGLQIDTKTSTQYDGQTKLDYLLKNDLNAFKEFFTKENSGFIDSVNKVINEKVLSNDDKGLIHNATATIEANKLKTEKEINKEKTRLNTLRDTMYMQFAQLNSVISRYESMSDYLTKQFENIGKIGK